MSQVFVVGTALLTGATVAVASHGLCTLCLTNLALDYTKVWSLLQAWCAWLKSSCMFATAIQSILPYWACISHPSCS